jgi:serine/threonine protein kinase
VWTGTPAYLSPEQARPEVRLIGPQSDQFSLATILYDMLTPKRQQGFRAFAHPGDGPPQILRRILTEDPLPLAVPEAPEVWTALERAFRRSRQQRFPTIHEFVRQIGLPGSSGQHRTLRSARTEHPTLRMVQRSVSPVRQLPVPRPVRLRLPLILLLTGLGATTAGALIAILAVFLRVVPPPTGDLGPPVTRLVTPADMARPPEPARQQPQQEQPPQMPLVRPPPRPPPSRKPIFKPDPGSVIRGEILMCFGGNVPRGIRLKRLPGGSIGVDRPVPGLNEDILDCLQGRRLPASIPELHIQ